MLAAGQAAASRRTVKKEGSWLPHGPRPTAGPARRRPVNLGPARSANRPNECWHWQQADRQAAGPGAACYAACPAGARSPKPSDLQILYFTWPVGPAGRMLLRLAWPRRPARAAAGPAAPARPKAVMWPLESSQFKSRAVKFSQLTVICSHTYICGLLLAVELCFGRTRDTVRPFLPSCLAFMRPGRRPGPGQKCCQSQSGPLRAGLWLD